MAKKTTNTSNKKVIETALPRLIRNDPYLLPYADKLLARIKLIKNMENRLTGGRQKISDFAQGHKFFGVHKAKNEWVLREWAPNATKIYLIGDFNNWREEERFVYRPMPEQNGVWELRLPLKFLKHGDLFKLKVKWHNGDGERIPAYIKRVVQDETTKIFSAQIWDPPSPYKWELPDYRRKPEPPLIYETHVGMAQEEGKVGSFNEFREKVLPRIIKAGYNTVQFMAIQEHPYYGSFGYHVTNFFAVSSRFGTPDDFKALVDACHKAGLSVIMDIIHSHSAKNEVEGLSRFDGTLYQYFHDGGRGEHWLWDSRCFDYGKIEVLHFLLSNCRFWLEEYKVDGFRFDGVTSMLYTHHGLGKAFTSYDDYFNESVDEYAVAYLALANKVIHEVRPDAITIAEDVSGMPGLAAPPAFGGIGFDFRLAMGVPDHWIKLTKDKSDEDWHMGGLWYELTNRRADEKTINYAESHDQALVGDQTLIFRMIERDMYTNMAKHLRNLRVDRGLALHKMIRMITIATAGGGYLNFMGNEFGHPEWIDFPREGNGWSYHYARRQWSLRDRQDLVYHYLADFDEALIELIKLTKLLEHMNLILRLEHCDDHLLGFERANLLFLFNFHPTNSYTDYPVEATPGSYRLILDTDAPYYGGHGRLAPNQLYFTFKEPYGRYVIKTYLPARTGIALLRLPS